MDRQQLNALHASLVNGRVIPYIGPGVLQQTDSPATVPTSPQELVALLTAKVSVPHKIRGNLTAAAQFIENFKHRKTLVAAMTHAFTPAMPPTPLHRLIAALPSLPLWVHAWYDSVPQRALADVGRAWGMVQGVSQAEHPGEWVHYHEADGSRRTDLSGATGEPAWPTLLYQPLGSVAPARNFLISDSDFVEVLTEIDIQTPIPRSVQALRSGRQFLFLGCRFATQLERILARQIIKRSGDRHWAILREEPTRNERRFLDEHHIERIPLSPGEFTALLTSIEHEATNAGAAG